MLEWFEGKAFAMIRASRNSWRSRVIGSNPTRTTRLLLEALLVAAATLACVLPFLGRPLHVDDPLFVWIAQQIAAHPLDFYGFPVNWNLVALPVHEYTQNPPLASYWLALVGSALGWSEAALHAGMAVPTLLTTLGIWALARLLCAHAVWAVAIALATPVFLVSATTLMCDVPMLGFWCWAVFFWVLGHRRESPAWLFVAAAFVAVAGLTKYFGVSLVPLLAAHAIATRSRRMSPWAIAALSIPIACFIGYEWLTLHLYDRGLLSAAFGYARDVRGHAAGWQAVVNSLVYAVVYPGGCALPLALLAPWLGGRRFLALLGAFVAAFAALAWLVLDVRPPPESMPSFRLHGLVYSIAGAVLLALPVLDLARRRNAESLLLALWVAGTIAFAMFGNWAPNARSVLPLVPAVAILAVRRLEARGVLTSRGRWSLAAPLAVAFAAAFLVAYADYRHAVADRDAARRIVATYQHGDRQRVWYMSHWGFHYYLQQAGLAPLDVRGARLAAGDIYVQPQVASGRAGMIDPVIELVETLEVPAARLGSTASSVAGAGFYSQMIGPLPFTLGPQSAPSATSSIA